MEQAPFNIGGFDASTLSFSSSEPIAVTALRILNVTIEGAGESTTPVASLISSIPVESLSTFSTDTVHFPMLFAGGDWSASVVLINTTDEELNGTLEVSGTENQSDYPATAYTILPQSIWGKSYSESPPGYESSSYIGSVKAIPDPGSLSPEGLLLHSFTSQTGDEGSPTISFIFSEVILPSVTPGSAFRLYIEGPDLDNPDDSPTNLLMIRDVSGAANNATFELTDIDGSFVAQLETFPISAGEGILFRPIDILSLPSDFQGGLLRITSDGDVVVSGMKTLDITPGQSKLERIPQSNEADPAGGQDTFFPIVMDSDGWATRFILFGAQPGSGATGTLESFDPSGEPLDFGLVRVTEPLPVSTYTDLLTGQFRILAADGVSNVVTTMSFDGIGSGVTTEVLSFSGDETDVVPAVSITYDITQDRGVSLILDPGSDQQTFGGIVSSDNESFLLASTDEEPTLIVAHKARSGLSNSILNGDYVAGAASNESDSLVQFSFDGAGTGSFDVVYDLQEGEAAAGELIPFTYLVNSNGELLVVVEEDGEEENFLGMVNASGSSFNLASVSDPANLIIVGHELKGTFSELSLAGQYVAGALLGEATALLTLDFDGVGAGSLIVENGDTGSNPETFPFTYEVDSGGLASLTFELVGINGLNLRGVIREDTSQLVLIGAEGSTPLLIVAFSTAG